MERRRDYVVTDPFDRLKVSHFLGRSLLVHIQN